MAHPTRVDFRENFKNPDAKKVVANPKEFRGPEFRKSEALELGSP